MTEETADRGAAAPSPALAVARHAGAHLLLWLAAFGLFAATDSWHTLNGLGLASLLCVVSGIIAGFATTTILHEWFHLLGARLSGGAYTVPAKIGLFIYDWDFERNNLRQFYLMSIAGSIGGALAVLGLWAALPTDTTGRAALLAAALAAFVFAAAIEWPVLLRCRRSGDPLAELSKTDKRVLLRCLALAILAGAAGYLAL